MSVHHRPALLLSVAWLLLGCGAVVPTTGVDGGSTPPRDPCADCADDSVCLERRCVPRQCAAERCAPHEACIGGTCRPQACAGINCPAGSTCTAIGLCVQQACDGSPPCPEGEVCADGTCMEATCAGVACPEGTSCVEGLCLERSCGAEPCPGDGFCLEGTCTERACVGVVCPADKRCFGGTCADCAPGTWPPGDGAPCEPEQDAGTACTAHYQCGSGNCVDGTCCEAACNGPCSTCAGGSCAPLPAGAADAQCQGYTCLSGGTCGQNCTDDSACVEGYRCANGACTPKAAPGTPCSAGADCGSGHCVDGTCCTTACDAPCATCSAPGQEGTCVPSPAGAGCRPAATACDVPESCDGTSTACPPDTFQPDGAACGTVVEGTWGDCVLGATCSGSGTRTRTVTTSTCQAGACTPSDTAQSEACTVNTSGAPCGTPTYGAWSTCSFSSTCDEAGTRTRTVTRFTCTASGCTDPQTTTETGTCTRDTDGTSCGTTQAGAWSSCGYSNSCDETAADRTRTVTRYACQAGACTATTSTERDACARNTDGDSCGTTAYEAWSTCGGYASTCDESGVQSRRVTRRACAAGSCVDSTSNETRSCSRNTDGNGCGTTTYGSWSTCGGYASTCDETGVQSRRVTQKVCSAGACGDSTSNESRSCTRDTDGATCGRTGCGDRCANGLCVFRCSPTPACMYC